MRTTLGLAAFCVLLSLSASMAQPSYDLVIVNGRVMDPETKTDRIATVGIRAGSSSIATRSSSPSSIAADQVLRA